MRKRERADAHARTMREQDPGSSAPTRRRDILGTMMPQRLQRQGHPSTQLAANTAVQSAVQNTEYFRRAPQAHMSAAATAAPLHAQHVAQSAGAMLDNSRMPPSHTRTTHPQQNIQATLTFPDHEPVHAPNQPAMASHHDTDRRMFDHNMTQRATPTAMTVDTVALSSAAATVACARDIGQYPAQGFDALDGMCGLATTRYRDLNTYDDTCVALAPLEIFPPELERPEAMKRALTRVIESQLKRTKNGNGGSDPGPDLAHPRVAQYGASGFAVAPSGDSGHANGAQVKAVSPNLPCWEDPISVFFSVVEPEISVQQYVGRLAKYAQCSQAAFVTALVYMDRLAFVDSKLVISPYNLHRLLITSLCLAAKFLDDKCFSNAHYARVGGIESVGEMNRLERHLLQRLKHRLFVTPHEYAVKEQMLLYALACTNSSAVPRALHQHDVVRDAGSRPPQHRGAQVLGIGDGSAGADGQARSKGGQAGTGTGYKKREVSPTSVADVVAVGNGDAAAQAGQPHQRYRAVAPASSAGPEQARPEHTRARAVSATAPGWIGNAGRLFRAHTDSSLAPMASRVGASVAPVGGPLGRGAPCGVPDAPTAVRSCDDMGAAAQLQALSTSSVTTSGSSLTSPRGGLGGSGESGAVPAGGAWRPAGGSAASKSRGVARRPAMKSTTSTASFSAASGPRHGASQTQGASLRGAPGGRYTMMEMQE